MKKMIMLALPILLVQSIACYGNEDFTRLNDAIDNNDLKTSQRLAPIVILNQSQKNDLIKNSQKWVDYYDLKVKSFWRNGPDSLKLVLGAIFGTTSFIGALYLANDELGKDKHAEAYISAGLGTAVAALNYWMMCRGWRLKYYKPKLSNARQILELVQNITVK